MGMDSPKVSRDSVSSSSPPSPRHALPSKGVAAKPAPADSADEHCSFLPPPFTGSSGTAGGGVGGFSWGSFYQCSDGGGPLVRQPHLRPAAAAAPTAAAATSPPLLQAAATIWYSGHRTAAAAAEAGWLLLSSCSCRKSLRHRLVEVVTRLFYKPSNKRAQRPADSAVLCPGNGSELSQRA